MKKFLGNIYFKNERTFLPAYKICVFFALFSLLCFSAMSEVSDFDQTFDYIPFAFNYKDPQSLIKTIKIFSNKNLKGKPVFLVDNENIHDLRSDKKLKKSKLDFVIYNPHGIRHLLRITKYENGIAEVIDSGISYFTKLSKENFRGGDYPYSTMWKIIKGKEALKILNETVFNEKNLREQFVKINSCLDKEDIVCLRILLNEKEFPFAEKANLLWKYINLPCNEVHDRSGMLVKRSTGDYDGMKKTLTNIAIPWDSLRKVFKLDLKPEEVQITTKNFGEINGVEIETHEELYCDGKAEKSIILDIVKLKNDKNKNIWKIRLIAFAGKITER